MLKWHIKMWWFKIYTKYKKQMRQISKKNSLKNKKILILIIIQVTFQEKSK